MFLSTVLSLKLKIRGSLPRLLVEKRVYGMDDFVRVSVSVTKVSSVFVIISSLATTFMLQLHDDILNKKTNAFSVLVLAESHELPGSCPEKLIIYV